MCWGQNGYGQLGDGTILDRYVPTLVKGLGGVVSVAAGNYHTCAVKLDHTLWCWGLNWTGQLGDGTTTNKTSPVPVLGLADGVVWIAAGGYHTCANEINDGSPWCWGANGAGQLGNGTNTSSSSPAHVPSPEVNGLGYVVAGEEHTCAAGLSVWCWGKNDLGQLGDGTMINRASPAKVMGLGGIYRAAAGHNQTCAIGPGNLGTLWCWGEGTPAPAQVTGLPAVGEVALGGNVYPFGCANTNPSKGLWCWGANLEGELGNGSTPDSAPPGKVCALGNGSIRFATGSRHACAIKSDRSLWCWGFNEEGELGDGTIAGKTVPVQIH